MVTTNDPELYHRLTLYRNNFLERDSTRIGRPLEPWEYEIQDVSGNFHLTEFQAALGLSQLARHAQHVQQRRALVKLYRQQLKDVPNLRLLPGELDDHSAHHLMLALIDFAALKRSRAAVMAALKEQGIGTQVHYIPLYKQPFFQRIANGDMSEYFPHSEAFYSQVLTLPLFPAMEEGDVQRVGSALKKSLD
jgi:dTDP-4-amino-4,6-dideoxygalactose transaminase